MLAHHVKRCAASQSSLDVHVHNLTELRQLSLELSCWEVGRIFIRLKRYSCASPCVLVSKFQFASINSAKLPEARTTEHSDFDRFVHLDVQCPKVGPFSRALSQNRCATRASRNVLTIFETFFKNDITRMADTPCRKSPFAMNSGEVTVSCAWV